MRNREHIFSIMAILGSFIGGVGLILLTVFDTKHHTSLHRLFLLIFMLGVALSAVFTVVEVGPFQTLSAESLRRASIVGSVKTLNITAN